MLKPSYLMTFGTSNGEFPEMASGPTFRSWWDHRTVSYPTPFRAVRLSAAKAGPRSIQEPADTLAKTLPAADGRCLERGVATHRNIGRPGSAGRSTPPQRAKRHIGGSSIDAAPASLWPAPLGGRRRKPPIPPSAGHREASGERRRTRDPILRRGLVGHGPSDLAVCRSPGAADRRGWTVAASASRAGKSGRLAAASRGVPKPGRPASR
jgi:hypothetical protein